MKIINIGLLSTLILLLAIGCGPKEEASIQEIQNELAEPTKLMVTGIIRSREKNQILVVAEAENEEDEKPNAMFLK